MDIETICDAELTRVRLANQTPQQLWDSASTEHRKRWLKRTGSWTDDAALSWAEMMKQGGSQADVMRDFLKEILAGAGTELSADGAINKQKIISR
jgi:hypothetical protein